MNINNQDTHQNQQPVNWPLYMIELYDERGVRPRGLPRTTRLPYWEPNRLPAFHRRGHLRDGLVDCLFTRRALPVSQPFVGTRGRGVAAVAAPSLAGGGLFLGGLFVPEELLRFGRVPLYGRRHEPGGGERGCILKLLAPGGLVAAVREHPL